MGRKLKFSSITNFKQDILKVNNLIEGIIVTINSFAKVQENKLFSGVKEIVSKNKDSLVFDEKRLNEIYELGFIRLFASLESFMYDFLRELYLKFPMSMPTDKKIEVEHILNLKTQKSVSDFILDHIAIENSYDLVTWEKTLEKSFGIKIFKNESQREKINLLNLCRNMILHSGGKFNSKISRDGAKLFPNTIKNKKSKFQVEKMELEFKTLYYTLNTSLEEIIKNIEDKNRV